MLMLWLTCLVKEEEKKKKKKKKREKSIQPILLKLTPNLQCPLQTKDCINVSPQTIYIYKSCYVPTNDKNTLNKILIAKVALV
jgi:hypothetical protein